MTGTVPSTPFAAADRGRLLRRGRTSLATALRHPEPAKQRSAGGDGDGPDGRARQAEEATSTQRIRRLGAAGDTQGDIRTVGRLGEFEVFRAQQRRTAMPAAMP